MKRISLPLHEKGSVTKLFVMYSLVFFSILFMSQSALSQVDCVITSDTPPPVCYNSLVKLSGSSGENYAYLWEPGGQTTESIDVTATSDITYRLAVVDTVTGEQCLSAPFLLSVRPVFDINIEQMQLTCTNGDNDNGNTAMIQATASGASSAYHYFWDVRPIQIAPGDSSLAIGLKAHLWYFLRVKDDFGCIQTDSFFTTAYPNPDINILTDPDTAYIQNPYITFSFENLTADSIEVTNHFWDFGDDTPTSDFPTPRHLYTEEGTYNVFLTVFNPQACDTIFTKEVKVLPVKLQVPNILTPNGDGTNDVFEIVEAPPGEDDINPMFKEGSVSGKKPLSLYYKSTSLLIFNRQGRKVFESDDYQNDWKGEGLSDGVYFYVLKCVGFKSNEVYKGSITLVSGRNN